MLKKVRMSLETIIAESVIKQLNKDKSIETALVDKLEALGFTNASKPIKIEFKEKVVNVGKQHFKFKTVLKAISAKTNLALVGPAGSGKTTVVSSVAKSLDLPFYSKSVSIQTGTHEFFGYYDANGKYVSTMFRNAYENGGVFLVDEFDAGNPNVLAALNQATANNQCPFPDKMINKHKDFIVVMAGNTYGHGATSEYVGRNKIDAATLDRFVFIDFPYDEDLELELSSNKKWCRKIQKIRKRAVEKKVLTIISPRATFQGEKLLSAGVSEKDVLNMVVYKNLSKDEIDLINGDCREDNDRIRFRAAMEERDSHIPRWARTFPTDMVRP